MRKKLRRRRRWVLEWNCFGDSFAAIITDRAVEWGGRRRRARRDSSWWRCAYACCARWRRTCTRCRRRPSERWRSRRWPVPPTRRRCGTAGPGSAPGTRRRPPPPPRSRSRSCSPLPCWSTCRRSTVTFLRQLSSRCEHFSFHVWLTIRLFCDYALYKSTMDTAVGPHSWCLHSCGRLVSLTYRQTAFALHQSHRSLFSHQISRRNSDAVSDEAVTKHAADVSSVCCLAGVFHTAEQTGRNSRVFVYTEAGACTVHHQPAELY